MKRTKIKTRSVNPLFEQWLMEWKEEAAMKESPIEHSFAKALQSLRKCPLVLKNASDCILLEHFGKKLCLMLERKMQEYNSQVEPRVGSESNRIPINSDLDSQVVKEKQRKLHEDETEEPKEPVAADSKNNKNSRNKKKLVAKKDDSGKSSSSSSNLQTTDCLSIGMNLEVSENGRILEPNSFDILLLVDLKETAGKKVDKDPTTQTLTAFGVPFQVHNLKVGDFLWIAKDKFSDTSLVLPYIAERKRIDDFASSIKDGRYKEQKFRLKQCGIENLIYLVESHGKNERVGLPLSNVLQAAVNTAVQDDFIVKYTQSHSDSLKYLGIMTKQLMNIFKMKRLQLSTKANLQSPTNPNDNILPLMELKEFNKLASKTKDFKVKQMFIKQLLQIQGISVDKAIAIVENYPTPKLLFDAFRETSENEKLLASIQCGAMKRSIGPALSKIIYDFYTRKELN